MPTEPLEENPAAGKSAPTESLVLVNTGDGKGKSSAAFGVVLRALARDWRVAVFQFIKSGDWNVGEEKMGRQLGVDWFNQGEGFTWDSEDLDHDKALAAAGWAEAKAAIEAGDHQLVVLDELTYLMNWEWIDAHDVITTILDRPTRVNIVVTGRDAPPELIDVADTATEMVKIKHAFDAGQLAKKGIDF